MEKLDFLVRFWALKARHQVLGEPLSAAEQIELLSLLQLVTSELKLPPAGPLARAGNPSTPRLLVDLIGEGSIVAGELHTVSAGALFLVSPLPMLAGASVMVRATDAVSGVELSLPCRVAWSYGSGPASLALRVDGVPGRSLFSTMPEPPPHMCLSFGGRAPLLG